MNVLVCSTNHGCRADVGPIGLKFLAESSFKTLESLAYHLSFNLFSCIPESGLNVTPVRLIEPAALLAEDPEAKNVALTVEIRKPAAIAFAKHPSITFKRTLGDYFSTGSQAIKSQTALQTPGHETDTTVSQPCPASIAYLAIGTNIGDRVGHIKTAMSYLPRIAELANTSSDEFLNITRCSRLYQSEPMYLLDQDQFLNGVIEVSLCDTAGPTAQAERFLTSCSQFLRWKPAYHLWSCYYTSNASKTSWGGSRPLTMVPGLLISI